MNRFKIWLIAGLLVIIALAGLVYIRGRLPAESPDVSVKAPTIKVEVEKKKPKGFAKPVEPSPQKKATDDAKAIVNALDSGDISDCSKITWNETMREQCEDSLNYNSILKSGDASQCNDLNDEALRVDCFDKAYMSAAVDQRDSELCEKITDAGLKQMCLDQIQMVVTRYATSADDCSPITSDLLRKQCEDSFYLKSSAKELNAEGCNNISDSNVAEQCKETVTRNIEAMERNKIAAENASSVKTLQEILDLCEGLNESKAILCKDSVYPQLAFDKKDVSYCNKISDELKAGACTKEQGDKINSYYLRQSLASHDKSVCDQISDTELKDLCKNS